MSQSCSSNKYQLNMRQKKSIERVHMTHRNSHRYHSTQSRSHSINNHYNNRGHAPVINGLSESTFDPHSNLIDKNSNKYQAVDSTFESRTKKQCSVDSRNESCSKNGATSYSKMVTSSHESHSSHNYECVVYSKFNVSDFCVYDGNVVVVNWVLGKNVDTSQTEYAVKRGNNIPFVVCENKLSHLMTEKAIPPPCEATNDVIEPTGKTNNKRDRKRVRQKKYRTKKRERLDEIFTITESNTSPIHDGESFSPLLFDDLEFDKFQETLSQPNSPATVPTVEIEKPRLKFKISKRV